MQIAGNRSVPKMRIREERNQLQQRTKVNRENLNNLQRKGNLKSHKHQERDDLWHVGREDIGDALLEVVEYKTAFCNTLRIL
jgi:hypothetical protein